MSDWSDSVLAEQLRKQSHHHLAVFQHVADAAGHAQIVFQDVVLAFALSVWSADDVDAADVGVDVAWHIDAHHFRSELGVLENLFSRDQPVLDDFLVVVHVVDKPVQRRDTLHQPFFHAGPLLGGNDAGDQIKGNQAFAAGPVFILVAIHRKGDADTPKNHFGFGSAGLHRVGRLLGQPALVALVVGSHAGGAGVHFVKHRSAHGLISPANSTLFLLFKA